MLITSELLKAHQACSGELRLFNAKCPNGLEPTVENAIVAAAAGFDVIWCVRLLPLAGLNSQVAFALWCAEQVAHLTTDPRIATCLAIVAAEVANPGSQDMAAIEDAVRGAEAAAWWAEAAEDAAARAAEATAEATAGTAWTARAAASAAWAVARTAWTAEAAAGAAEAAWVAIRAAAEYAEDAAEAAWVATRAATEDAEDVAWAARAAARDAQIAMLARMLSDV